MSQEHSGLCVGGPMAGQRLASERTRVDVQQQNEPLTLKQSLKGSIDAGAISVKTITYNWHHLGPFGIWIVGGKSVNDALNDMAIAYSEKHNGRR